MYRMLQSMNQWIEAQFTPIFNSELKLSNSVRIELRQLKKRSQHLNFTYD